MQAKAKAQEELNKVQARVNTLKAELKALIDPPVVVEAPVVVVAPPVVVAPVTPAVVVPVAPVEDDGFANVVPTDLKDLVDEKAAPAPRRNDFASINGIAGLEDLMEDSASATVTPLKEDPFAEMLPNDSKDLAAAAAFITPAPAGAALDIDDGEFEALKNEAGLGDVNEGRRLSDLATEDSLTTLMFGDHNLAL